MNGPVNDTITDDSDIVQQLRSERTCDCAWTTTMAEAADEIERLRHDISRAIANHTADLNRAVTLCTFGPPAERKRRWILKFEDADKGDMHFIDEAEALAMFDKCSLNWTCTLFVTAGFSPDKDGT